LGNENKRRLNNGISGSDANSDPRAPSRLSGIKSCLVSAVRKDCDHIVAKQIVGSAERPEIAVENRNAQHAPSNAGDASVVGITDGAMRGFAALSPTRPRRRAPLRRLSTPGTRANVAARVVTGIGATVRRSPSFGAERAGG
jgi:hypothetical protein